jgi:hypothetical protein
MLTGTRLDAATMLRKLRQLHAQVLAKEAARSAVSSLYHTVYNTVTQQFSRPARPLEQRPSPPAPQSVTPPPRSLSDAPRAASPPRVAALAGGGWRGGHALGSFYDGLAVPLPRVSSLAFRGLVWQGLLGVSGAVADELFARGLRAGPS